MPVCVLLLSLLACRGDGDAVPEVPATTASTAETAQPLPTSTQPDLDVLRSRLQGEGFVIGEGRSGVLPLDSCCDWISCFKWNPSSAYALWFLPLAPGESPVGRDLDDDGLAWHWRLRSDEAIVSIGPTPPPMRYHSYRTYIHATWSDSLQAHIPGFDNLGDSLNQLVMNTEGGEPWNATTVIISAIDAEILAQVRDSLVASGYPEAWINTDIIPADRVVLGLHDEADTVRMIHRVALFDDPLAGAAWQADPPETIWRLTPEVEKPDLVPIEVPPFRTGGRPPGDDESSLGPAVEALAQAIRDAHPDALSVEAPVNVRELDLEEDCWSGCNRDSHQSNIAAVTFPEGPDHFMVAFGVNHHATGRASYQNAIVFGVDNDDPAAWVDDPDFVGSARDYLPDHPDVDKLYAWSFSRDCAGKEHCSELATGCPGLSEGEKAAIHFRSYLDPQTGVAPYADELQSERVLVFKPAATGKTSP